MAVDYPPRVELAQLPTPLILLERLSARYGGARIWVKRDDLTGFGLSGNKVRKLEFCIADALAQGCDTLITCGGIQSNHCRATAVAARRVGLGVHLVLRGVRPADVADGNLFINQLVGADISFVSLKDYYSRLDAIYAGLVADYAAAGHKAYTMPVGASDEVGLWGYIRCCEELAADFAAAGIRPGHIISATGSGGTQGGLTAGAALHGLDATVWGINVCDDAQWFHDKITADFAAWQHRYSPQLDTGKLTILTIDGYVGPGYAKATDDVFATIREVARTEGLLLDPVYTGKAFHGMLEEMKAGRFDGADDIVFIHTGGFFGLYPQREQALANAD